MAASPKVMFAPITGHADLDNVFIGISGLIGAGKTTLATALGKALDLPVFFEPVIDNEYLADFYKETAKYAFQLQIYLLNRRFKQHQQIIWEGRGGVQDRTIYEDSVFCKMLRDAGLLDDRDYRTYVDLFSNMSNFMRKPNIIIHLDVTPEESLERVQMRNRDCETGSESTLSLEYLQNLKRAYDEFIKDIARVIPVIRVRWDKFRSAEEVALKIKEVYEGISNVRSVSFEDDKSPPSPNITTL